MVDTKFTPLPPQGLSPVRVEAADWFDLNDRSSTTMLDHRRFSEQAVDVRRIGARPEQNVQVIVETARRDSEDGRVTDEDSFDTTGLGSFGNYTTSGPFATERLVWKARNRSGTAYTQGNGNAYQAHINYVVKRMTLVEKLRRGIPLDDRESEAASELGILDMERSGLPLDVPDYLKATTEGKVIRERESEVETVDIASTGPSNSVTVASESKLEDRDLVAYVTGLRINSQEFSRTDNLKVQFTRNGTDDFYDIETYGMPGISNGYKSKLHIPFLFQMDVSVYADNSQGNTPTSVDVQVEYDLVERSLIEKAMYGLKGEVPNDNLYERVRNRVGAGLPINGDVLNENGDKDGTTGRPWW